jgi:oxygen-independent coproporphyrinogen-3 oxidase
VDTSVGLYVHLPFCERVCPYCDFAVVAAPVLGPAVEARYVAAVLAELDQAHADYADLRLESVYFGGGTPALFTPASIGRIVQAARERFACADSVEVTLEANPSTLERERLPGFRAAGANRLSLGIQSFDDLVLRRLGRAHRGGEAHAALAAARRAGFDNVSLDLILGAPAASEATLEQDLDVVLAFGPEHVSAYLLTLEAGTPFARAAARGQLALADEEAILRMLDATQARLAGAGLVRYEVSSYARAGFESRHNRRYWQREPVLGIGLGAWSTLPRRSGAAFGARRQNLRGLAAYLAAVEVGLPPRAAPDEVLAERTARGEAMFLGLRTRAGVSGARFAAEFGGPPRAFFAEAIEALVAAGLLSESPQGDLALTAKGFPLSDTVFEHFV